MEMKKSKPEKQEYQTLLTGGKISTKEDNELRKKNISAAILKGLKMAHNRKRRMYEKASENAQRQESEAVQENGRHPSGKP